MKKKDNLKNKSEMKKKGKAYSKWWLWVGIGIVLIIIIAAGIFYGYRYAKMSQDYQYCMQDSDCIIKTDNCRCSNYCTNGVGGSISAQCIRSVNDCINDQNKLVFSSCKCQKNKCIPQGIIPNNPPINNTLPPLPTPPIPTPVINNTNPPTPTTPATEGKFKIEIKLKNPTFKIGQDIPIYYTITNSDNKAITISNTNTGIQVKNPGGIKLNYNGTGSGIPVLTEPLTLGVGNKSSGSVIIKGNDYNFFTIGNNADGYFDSISVYIGDTWSNVIIPRFLKY
jgi:hypothetical protein